MAKAKVTSKGQITIPKEIREKLHLNPGDKLLFEETKQGEVKISTQKNQFKIFEEYYTDPAKRQNQLKK